MPLVMRRMAELWLLFLSTHPTIYPRGGREKCQQAQEYPSSNRASGVIRSAKPRILIDEDATMHQLQPVHDGDCAYSEK